MYVQFIFTMIFSFSQDSFLPILGHSVCVTGGRKGRVLNMVIEKARPGEESAMLRYLRVTGKIVSMIRVNVIHGCPVYFHDDDFSQSGPLFTKPGPQRLCHGR